MARSIVGSFWGVNRYFTDIASENRQVLCCGRRGASTGQRNGWLLQSAAFPQQVGNRLGQPAVSRRIGMDIVGLQGAVGEHRRQNLFLDRDLHFRGRLPIEGRWRQGKAQGRHRDDDDGDAPFLRQPDHLPQILGRLPPIVAAEQVIASVAEDHQPGLLLFQDLRQAGQPFRCDLSGDPGIHHPPADQPLQDRRIAFRRRGPGPEGQAVSEGEDDGVAG